MKIEKTNIKKIPPRGVVIAYTDESVIYTSYKVIDGKVITDSIKEDKIANAYEYHFFDTHKEYRLIYRESRNDIIEMVATKSEEDTMDSDLIYTEDVLVDPKYLEDKTLPKMLRIINRYRYSHNDTLVLDNYRIGLP